MLLFNLFDRDADRKARAVQAQLRYRAKNPRQRQQQMARFRVEQPERHRSNQRKYHLKRKGISAEEYDRMFASQGGVCAICRQPETIVIRGTQARLAVDHDHATGRVRGLLCSYHNTGIGLFLDSPDLLRAAIDYLERNK